MRALVSWLCSIALVAGGLEAARRSEGDRRDLFGRAVCAVGDVDGDGRADFAVSDRSWRSHEWSDWSRTTRGGYGAVWIVSGHGGAPIRRFEGHVPGTTLGWELSAEDVDRDGALDLVLVSSTWTSGENLLEVRSGRTAEPLIELCWPVEGAPLFALADDVDGDGVAEVIVADRQRRGGRVRLVASASGYVLGEHAWAVDGARSCGNVLAHADLDGDGLREVLIATRSAVPRAPGSVRVCSGRDLGLLATWAPVPRLNRLAAAGDLDGDGIADVALVGLAGTVPVRSGADGSLLFETAQAFADRHALAPVGDVDGDGTPDLAVGDCDVDIEGAVFLVSGRDGSTLRRIRPEGIENRWFGSAVAGCGDVDLDGVSDLVVGAGCPVGNEEPGEVAVYSGRTGAKLLRIDRSDMRR